MRSVLKTFYALFLSVYIVLGLQPVAAVQLDIIGTLTIPAANITSDVTEVQLDGATLNAPADIVGAFQRNQHKTFLFAHSTTAFKNLQVVRRGDSVYYLGKSYHVIDIKILAKEDIDMEDVIAETEKDTIVMMTCCGQSLGGGDFSHRLIVTAEH